MKSFPKFILAVSDDWRKQAECALPENRDLMWFPPEWRGVGSMRMKVERLRVEKVCDACPVLVECRDFAERNHVTSGIWAGKHYGSFRDED